MGIGSKAMDMKSTKYGIGQVVRHRLLHFRGVIYDVDAEFSNSDEWYNAIPEEIRPEKNQPFYHIYAENDDNHYTAYVSEQNLIADDCDEPLEHPAISKIFGNFNPKSHSYSVNSIIN